MKRLLKRLLAYLPSKLPVGMTEFHEWADSIIELTGPIADANSLKWALAMSVLHAGEAMAYKPKIYFVHRLLKGASNQIVSQVIQDLKNAQKAAAEEAMQAAETKNREEAVVQQTELSQAQPQIKAQAHDLSRGKIPSNGQAQS